MMNGVDPSFQFLAIYALKKYVQEQMILTERDISKYIIIGADEIDGMENNVFLFGSNFLGDILRGLNSEDLISTFSKNTHQSSYLHSAFDFFNFKKKIINAYITLEKKKKKITTNDEDDFTNIVIYIINSKTNTLTIGAYKLLKETIMKIAKLKCDKNELDWDDWGREI